MTLNLRTRSTGIIVSYFSFYCGLDKKPTKRITRLCLDQTIALKHITKSAASGQLACMLLAVVCIGHLQEETRKARYFWESQHAQAAAGGGPTCPSSAELGPEPLTDGLKKADYRPVASNICVPQDTVPRRVG